jgi:hypothetical protein
MKTSRFSEQQIAFVLRQAEEGTAVTEGEHASKRRACRYREESRLFPQIRKLARFARTGWWIVVGSNRGPHHDAARPC